MVQLIGQAVDIFCFILQCCIVVYAVLSWLPQLKGFKVDLFHILDPLFSVVRYLMKHSIFVTNCIDLTPFVAFVIVSYIRTLLA